MVVQHQAHRETFYGTKSAAKTPAVLSNWAVGSACGKNAGAK
jgi:hypothetical protein